MTSTLRYFIFIGESWYELQVDKLIYIWDIRETGMKYSNDVSITIQFIS